MVKYLHAKVNGRAAFWSNSADELAILPANTSRFAEDASGHPTAALDSLGRPVNLDWQTRLAGDAVKIYYTVKKVYHEWREEDKFKIRI